MLQKLMLFLLIFIFLFSALNYSNDNPDLGDFMSVVSEQNSHLSPTISVYNYCKNRPSNISKVYCVNNYVLDNFNYNKSPITKNIDNILISGGDCKAYATFYKSVFDMMGLDNNLVFIKNHVYNVVYNGDFYCNVDQVDVDCHEYRRDE